MAMDDDDENDTEREKNKQYCNLMTVTPEYKCGNVNKFLIRGGFQPSAYSLE
jgi:hypothetical protein